MVGQQHQRTSNEVATGPAAAPGTPKTFVNRSALRGSNDGIGQDIQKRCTLDRKVDRR